MGLDNLRPTLDRYLRLIAPVVAQEDFYHTKKLVGAFGISGGQGEKLQQLLKKIAETKENWVLDWWIDDMYMNNPASLPMNSNPGLMFPRHNISTAREWIRFAAQFISGILDYKTIIDQRQLPIDRVSHNRKGQPLCMEQYYQLFTSYRYPGLLKDSHDTKIMHDPFDSEYIIVAYKNQFFVLDVIANGQRFEEEEFYIQLRRIVQLVDENPQDMQPQIGILTSSPRRQWGAVYQHMLKSQVNAANLEKIAKSVFILCLDNSASGILSSRDEDYDDSILMDTDALHSCNMDIAEPCDRLAFEPRNEEAVIRQMLHGVQIDSQAGNRWYDKTMQFIIDRDGNFGLNYEHSVAEGIAVIRLVEHILAYMNEIKRWKLTRYASICERAQPLRLKWQLDDFIQEALGAAIEHNKNTANDLNLEIVRFNDYGREFPKIVNMSPDSWIQLALQLSHYKSHGYLVHTYESASIRRFHLGRVDNIRSSSVPALEWVKAMVDSKHLIS
ncbi:hypothetical protein Ciccas_009615, partial [Cichlidogyrus casuarinus]